MSTFQLIMIIIIVGIAIGSGIYTFVKMTREQKIANLKEWLKIAVVLAEKDLGSGTGALKLRSVYNIAIDKFPWIVSIVAFETFSIWVDEALEWMKEQLETNKKIEEFVNKAGELGQ